LITALLVLYALAVGAWLVARAIWGDQRGDGRGHHR
jgi:hypothetical protein